MELIARLVNREGGPAEREGYLELQHKEPFNKDEEDTHRFHEKLLTLEGVYSVRYVTPHVTQMLCSPLVTQHSVLEELLELMEWRLTE